MASTLRSANQGVGWLGPLPRSCSFFFFSPPKKPAKHSNRGEAGSEEEGQGRFKRARKKGVERS